MMRQSEFKMKFDPELSHFTKHHIWGNHTIYGEGVESFVKNKLSKKKSSAPAGIIDKKTCC